MKKNTTKSFKLDCMIEWMHGKNMQLCNHANFRLLNCIIYLILIFPFLFGCGDKFDVSQLTSSSGNANITGDTVYVQINPPWNGLNKPQDMIIGREPFVYVADTYNDRIVMMNLNGDLLGTRTVKRPVALAQDYKLNLIICAELDTVVKGQTQIFGAVYKLNLVAADHQIGSAPITRILPRTADLNYPNRKYTAVTVFYDNSFYIARTGPTNGIVDPDNSILHFGPDNTFIERVPNIDPISSGLVSANHISSLTSFNTKNIDFIETLTGNNNLKTQWLHYLDTPNFTGYVAQLTPSNGGALMMPNKFAQPEGSCLDDADNIYVADAQKDSVYKFTPLGDELQSFGGPDVFNEPYAVAFFDRVLYVLDSGNDRILRFILSTDIR